MPVHQGLPKDAKVDYQIGDHKSYSYQGKGIYEFIANDHEGWERIHTGLWHQPEDILHIYKGLTTEPSFRNEYNKDRVYPPLPKELQASLQRIKDKLHENPKIHIGWYAKLTSLQFIYQGELYEIDPKTLGLDDIDFSPAYDFDPAYEGGEVGNSHAYFEINERYLRKTLHEELGIEYFYGQGEVD